MSENADLRDVIVTDELDRRPVRTPDLAGENAALRELASAVAREPGSALARVVETALRLCGADSAGLTVHEEEGGVPVARWREIAGLLAPHRGRAAAREATPTALVAERRTMLLSEPGRAFPPLREADPPIAECLVTAFVEADAPAGSLWVTRQTPGRPFDAEDRRLLEGLAGFAAVAWRAEREREEARRTAEALRASEELRRLALESGEIGVWNIALPEARLVTDARFRLLFSGEEAEFDYETAFGLLHPDDRERVRERVESAAVPGGEYAAEYRVVHRDGRVRWLSARGRANLGPDGVVASLDGTVVDVTDRRSLQDALARDRERLAALFDQAPAFLAVLRGPDLVFEQVNAAYYAVVGHRPVVGLPLAVAIPESTGGGEGRDYDRLLREIMARGESVTYQARPVAVQRAPGGPVEERYLDLSYQPLREADGAVSGLLVLGTDVTEPIRAEREIRRLADELARQTSRWDAALSGIADYVFLFDRELRFRYANQVLLDLWGMAFDEVDGKTCADLAYPPEVEAQLEGNVRRVFETGERVYDETAYTSPTGESGYFEYVLSPVRGADGAVEVVAGSSRNVTEREAARRDLRESQEVFRTVFEQAPDDAILVLDADRRITAWNPAAERILGWPAAEVVGRSADLIFTPEDRAEGAPERETAAAARDGKSEDERWHLRRDGSRFWGSGTMNALHDEEGRVRGFLKIFRDATERYEMERALEAAVADRTRELREAMKEAEAFNYSISHDLRAPLRHVAATANMLLEDLGPALDPASRRLLERQNHNAKRLGVLIDELLRLSRLSRAEVRREPLDLTAMARAVASELEHPVPVEVEEGLTAEGDAGMVRTVLENLLGNAAKFSPAGGAVRVGREGDAIYVRDQGVGFDPEHASRIFLPFERLVHEDEFPGTGIGLANVERIVRRHGGRVWAEGSPGQGATFRFTLG